MTRLISFLELSAIIIAFTFFSACDSGTTGSDQKRQEKQATKQLSFVDASKGLPASEMWRQGLAISDINGDGHMDIVAPPPRKASGRYDKLVAWFGNGKGEWSETPLNLPSNIVYNYGSIAVSDFDGDKIPDIALAMHSVGLAALKGLGDKKYADFSEGMPSGKTLLSRALVSADFNNDGLPDIAALTEGPGKKGTGSDGVWVCCRTDERWKCNPIGKENEARGLFGDQLVTGDVNGDGNIDIAVGSFSGPVTMIVWLGDGKGGFTPFNKGLPEMHIYPAVALADIDKDGRDDLVASVSGFGKDSFLGLKVFLSRPEGFEEISEGLPLKVFFSAVNVCDLNSDGSSEIIGATSDGGLRVFSYKDNRWRELDVLGLPREGMRKIYNIYCTDMNGDGLKDLAVNYASERGKPSGGVRVFFNNAADKELEGKVR